MRHADLRLTSEKEVMIAGLMNSGSIGTDIMTTTVIASETENGIGIVIVIVIVIGTATRKGTTGTIQTNHAKKAHWRTGNVTVSDIQETDPHPVLDGTKRLQGAVPIP